MPWEDELNEKQVVAIQSAVQNNAVVAGPGTGKTRTLLRKALQLVEEEVAPVSAIRIVNFTNSGVFDLKKRIGTPGRYRALSPDMASTFHSLALLMLRAAKSRSIPSPLVILDDWEETMFIDRPATTWLSLGRVDRAAKTRHDYDARWCTTADDMTDWLSVGQRKAYEETHALLKDLLGFTTRGELTYLWWQHLRSSPGTTLSEMSCSWTHILVDEYQDLNECEHEILQFLAKAGVSVFAVGDPNQSIYETMRHAHPRLCWEFGARVAPGKVHILNQSYRCPRQVLTLGRALLPDSAGVPDPEVCAKDGFATILSFPSGDGETSGLALLATELLKREPESRIMIAVPTRRLASAIVEELDTAPVDDRTKREKQDDEKYRLARALIRLHRDARDSVAAASAILLNRARSSRDREVVELLETARNLSKKVAQLLDRETVLPAKLARARDKVNETLEEMRQAGPLWNEVVQTVTGVTAVATDLEEAEQRVEEVLQGTEQLQTGKITVMTLHGSKGTEAEWVILPAVEPGFFERDNVGIAKEERRRLLYVGMTRAQKGLFISYARRRYGRQRYADPTSLSPIKGPSVFVQEICNHCRIRPVNATEFLKDFLSQKNT